MEKSALIDSDVNYGWNFLNYPIHSVSAKPEQASKEFVILLIHGFGASTDHWRFNIPVLSTKYEVHAVDLLGFGKSPKPQDVEYSGSLWKDQVVAYVKEKIKKPTIVVGNSLGGYAALAAGSELNELNAGVILLNAAGYFSEEKTIKKNMLQTSIETVAGIFLKNVVLQRLIFLGLGTSAKLLTPSLEAAILLMVIGTTFLAPVLLRIVLKDKPPNDGNKLSDDVAADPVGLLEDIS